MSTFLKSVGDFSTLFYRKKKGCKVDVPPRGAPRTTLCGKMVYNYGNKAMKQKNRSCRNDSHYLKILQWNAGALSQPKKTELQTTLTKYNIDVFSIMEANLTSNTLKYYNLKGYTLHLLEKYRQVASGILVGVKKDLTSEFKIIKEMGDDEDKAEIVRVDVWKNSNRYNIFATYNPPNNNRTTHA